MRWTINLENSSTFLGCLHERVKFPYEKMASGDQFHLKEVSSFECVPGNQVDDSQIVHKNCENPLNSFQVVGVSSGHSKSSQPTNPKEMARSVLFIELV